MITTGISFMEALNLTENDSFQNHSWSCESSRWRDLSNPAIFGDGFVESIAIKWSTNQIFTLVYAIRDCNDESKIHIRTLKQKFTRTLDLYTLCLNIDWHWGTLVALD